MPSRIDLPAVTGPGLDLVYAFEPLGLVNFRPAVGLAPAIVCLVADTNLFAGLADGFFAGSAKRRLPEACE
jgi:hypothetical protein